MEDNAYRRSRDFLATSDQSEQPTETPRVEQWVQGHDSTSIVTSRSIGSGTSAPESLQSMEQQIRQIQEMHQEDVDVQIPLSTVGKRNHEVQQTLMDAQEFMGNSQDWQERAETTNRYTSYMELVIQIVDSKPSSYQEVAQYQVWQYAMVEEYTSIMQNDVWEVLLRPTDRVVVGSHWIYKIKHNVDSSIKKYKARFMAKGFSQKEGIDFEETFALVAMYTSIRVGISLAGQMGWKIHQMDVKMVLINRELEEEVDIEQLEGFVAHSSETHM